MFLDVLLKKFLAEAEMPHYGESELDLLRFYKLKNSPKIIYNYKRFYERICMLFWRLD